jgi:hypothetical protein
VIQGIIAPQGRLVLNKLHVPRGTTVQNMVEPPLMIVHFVLLVGIVLRTLNSLRFALKATTVSQEFRHLNLVVLDLMGTPLACVVLVIARVATVGTTVMVTGWIPLVGFVTLGFTVFQAVIRPRRMALVRCTPIHLLPLEEFARQEVTVPLVQLSLLCVQ